VTEATGPGVGPGFGGSPLFSLLIPLWRPLPEHFRRLLASIHQLRLDAFEAIVCDDCSDDPATSNILSFAATSDRVRVHVHDRPRGLNAAARTALEHARGEFVAFLDQNDQILPQALDAVAGEIAATPEADVLYTDEDKIDLAGRVFDCLEKPDWSESLLLSEPYLGHLLVVRRSVLEEAGGIGDMFPDDEAYDIMLRVTEIARRVVHVPVVGYRWSWTSEPEPGEPARLPWSHRPMRVSLERALKRRGIDGGVVVSGPALGTFRVVT
jgi:glycosyltransferase involved in cell wall biosynthesis